MNEEERAKRIASMSQEEIERAVRLSDQLLESTKRRIKYGEMTNTELAKELRGAWEEVEFFSKMSDLLDEVILRLADPEGEK